MVLTPCGAGTMGEQGAPSAPPDASGFAFLLKKETAQEASLSAFPSVRLHKAISCPDKRIRQRGGGRGGRRGERSSPRPPEAAKRLEVERFEEKSTVWLDGGRERG